MKLNLIFNSVWLKGGAIECVLFRLFSSVILRVKHRFG